jgi:hypothetical protein
MIFVSSKFKRPTTINGEPFREVGANKIPAQRDSTKCYKMRQPFAPVSCGVLERFDRNSSREKSEGGPTPCPVISVAYGNLHRQRINRVALFPTWPKGGSYA